MVILAGIAVILMAVLVKLTQLYTDWLWFESLSYQSVFLTILLSDAGLRFAIGLLVFIVVFINLYLTRGQLLQAAQRASVFREGNILTIQTSPLSQYLNPGFITIGCLLLSFVTALLFSFSVTGDWVILQKFLHPTFFGTQDPIFFRDIGFYVFQFPFYQYLYSLATLIILLSVFWVAVIYLIVNFLQGLQPTQIWQSISARYHLSILAVFFFFTKAFGYQLDQYGLLFKHSGAVWGIGYTSAHTTLVAYKILTFLSILCALAILVNLYMRRFRLVVYSIGFLLLASVLLGGVYPELVQRLRVTPNELPMETPYLAFNIDYTRKAYNLDTVEKKSFPAGNVLTKADINNNRDTIDNIRLWDWEPLHKTFSQLQEIRTYYSFVDIDLDRYVVDGRYRQTMVSARELNQEKLPPTAKTWMNQHLTYTHGYGIAMSPVNEFTGEGLPAFFLKDIPPVTDTDLVVTRPEIYFGEMTDNYVVVNTKALEFDYSSGDNNAYCTYQGEGGVSIGNIIKRSMFAVALGDYKLMLSADVHSDSRILYYRNIKQRIQKIAPFLEYDEDPYIVLSDGRLYWIWDAYTVTDRYPYSEPYNRRMSNYIRNSVKITIDAYSGDTVFYVSDPSDPIILTYKKIFPNLFRSIDEMSADLRTHVRYPNDLFNVQSSMYMSYHMEDPQVFYSKEDKWNLPTELFGDGERQMRAYYTITKLPDENIPEFVLILPFTPQERKNMIAWMAARSDGDNYGKLLVYSFPKQELVFGPMQIEARINQDAVISQQLALWNQHGTRVIRGNLLVIPVNDALLYVEPLFLQAEQSQMPELRRVIVSHGDMVVMETTLERSLERIFGSADSQPRPTATIPVLGNIGEQQNPSTTSISDLARRADRYYEEAQTRLRQGDWVGYGNALSQLKQTLTELVNRTNQQ